MLAQLLRECSELVWPPMVGVKEISLVSPSSLWMTWFNISPTNEYLGLSDIVWAMISRFARSIIGERKNFSAKSWNSVTSVTHFWFRSMALKSRPRRFGAIFPISLVGTIFLHADEVVEIEPVHETNIIFGSCLRFCHWKNAWIRL